MTELTTETSNEVESREVYRSEDAQAILQIAIAQQTEDGELTRTQLLEIAQELGISSMTLTQAEQAWQLQRLEKDDLQAFSEFQRQRFQSHLIRFVVLNVVLLLVNVMTTGNLSWALYILLFWGAALGLQAWHTLQPNNHRYRQEFEKWRRRQKFKKSFNRVIDWLLGTNNTQSP